MDLQPGNVILFKRPPEYGDGFHPVALRVAITRPLRLVTVDAQDFQRLMTMPRPHAYYIQAVYTDREEFYRAHPLLGQVLELRTELINTPIEDPQREHLYKHFRNTEAQAHSRYDPYNKHLHI